MHPVALKLAQRLIKTKLRYWRHADGDGYLLHMVTDSESLFLDNGLIRKHLLEFVAARHRKTGRRDAVSGPGYGVQIHQ